MTIVVLIVALFIAVLLVLFGAQNAQPVSLHFFSWESSSVPLVLSLGVAMFIGALLTFVVTLPGRLSAWGERRGMQHRLDERRRDDLRPPPPAAPIPPTTPAPAAPAEPPASNEV